MKILSAEAIQTVDAKTIEYNEIFSHELMEMAAIAFFDYFVNKYFISHNKIALFCGTGNNGGDGIAVARMLHSVGYDVKLFVVKGNDRFSDDCAFNIDRAEKAGVKITKITSEDQIPDLNSISIIIDALFGTGF